MRNGLDLGGAYEATLGRIKAQGEDKARLGMAVLMWATHAQRPLQADEICHALAIRIGSTDLDGHDIPTIPTLLDCCQGLVTVDKGASTVRLIHVTLQEYLCTHPNLFDRAHSTIAEICLTYLNFQRDHSPNPQRTLFLDYSSLYWGTHMRMELSDGAKKFALQLLGQFDSHISAKFLWEWISRGFVAEYTHSRKSFSALHCISYFGIAEVANALIDMNRWDVNQRDGAGMTPLIWAARYGHEEVVRLLLRNRHIQPDHQDAHTGRTALSWAAGNGHEAVVRLFLGPQFINPGSIGRRWRKVPLVASLLLGRRYINPDSPSKAGRTPLSWAAENGREGVVKLLLGRKDVSPDIPDTEYGQTPLSLAAENGCERVLELLLGRQDVNPTISSKSGQIPLSLAAENGHEGIVRLLLGRKDTNPNSLSESGQTPLSLAAENGHEGIVKLLLGQNDVNPDSSSKFGRTPLSLAAENGHEGIVKILLGREDVNPDTPDAVFGQGPLLQAPKKRHEGVEKLLSGWDDFNLEGSSKSGRTPLS